MSNADVDVTVHQAVTQLSISRDGSIAQPEEHSPAPAFAPIQVHDGATVANVGGETRHLGTISVSGEEIANHGAPGSILASARTLHGTTPRTLEPSNIVSAGGIEMSLADAERYGYVKRDASGRYVEQQQANLTAAAAPAAADAGTTQDEGPAQFAPEVEGALAALVDGVDGSILHAVAGNLATRFAEAGNFEGLNVEALASQMGVSAERAGEFVNRYVTALNQQGHEFLEKNYGIEGDEFLAWCRENRPAKFKAATMRHATARDLGAYRELAQDFLNSVAPSEEALKAAGYTTKVNGDTLMVKYQGTWATAKALARTGVI